MKGHGWSAACLRAGALRLSLALMLGALVISGYVVAPLLFAHAPSHQMAGMLAGIIFERCNQGVFILLLAIAVFYWQLGERRKRCWLALLLILLSIAINLWLISPMMEAIKLAAGAIDALPKDDPQRMKFGALHGVSEVLHLCAALAAAWLVAVGFLPRAKVDAETA